MTDTDEPTHPDHDRPTDPSPPPSEPSSREMEDFLLSIKPGEYEIRWGVAFFCGENGMRGALPEADWFRLRGARPIGDVLPEHPTRDDERWQQAGGPVKVGPDGTLVPATKSEAATRDWLDHGVDGPSSLGRARLRVKGIVDLTPKLKPAPDHDGWRERHRKYKQAMADHDQTAIGKIMEEPLDLLHSEAPAEVAPVDFDALEQCVKLELAEWGRQVRMQPGSVGFERRIDGIFAIRVRFSPMDSLLEARLSPRDLARAWKAENGNARAAAERLVRASAVELQSVRAGERSVLTVPDVPLV